MWVWMGSELPFFMEGKESVPGESCCIDGVGGFSTAASDWIILSKSFPCLREVGSMPDNFLPRFKC